MSKTKSLETTEQYTVTLRVVVKDSANRIGMDRRAIDWGEGPQTAHCLSTRGPEQEILAHSAPLGITFYTGTQFPQEYWNRVQFVAEPTGHLLGQFYLERRGAEFIAHNGRKFTASDDEWTSPIMAEVGPDGNVLEQMRVVAISIREVRDDRLRTGRRDVAAVVDVAIDLVACLPL